MEDTCSHGALHDDFIDELGRTGRQDVVADASKAMGVAGLNSIAFGSAAMGNFGRAEHLCATGINSHQELQDA